VLQLVIVVVDGLCYGEHTLVQDASNKDAIGSLQPVKYDVLALLHAAQAKANVITGSA
jgi:hypothetical protein